MKTKIMKNIKTLMIARSPLKVIIIKVWMERRYVDRPGLINYCFLKRAKCNWRLDW